MNTLLKSDYDDHSHLDKKVIEDSFQFIDDQIRWIEQKLTMKIDHLIDQQFIQFKEEATELENHLSKFQY